MTTLVIVRGLPGSGKTTLAMEWLADHPGAGRVNRDELRFLHYGNYWPGQDAEHAITKIQQAQIFGLLAAGLDVISDDTNLKARNVKELMKIAAATGASVEFEDAPLSVPLDVCLQRAHDRSAAGGRHVPPEAIRSMHDRYLQGRTLAVPVLEEGTAPVVKQYVPRDLKQVPTYLFDIDGTLAIMGDRSPYAWDQVGVDTLNEPVALALEAHYSKGHYVILMSGRDASCYDETRLWLSKHLGIIGRTMPLFMREAGDMRKDSIVKSEIFWRDVEPTAGNIVGVYDDRSQVVRMWREMGLACFQVNYGDF